MYINYEIYFYSHRSEGVAAQVPVTANLMDYAGQTLHMSEEVRKGCGQGMGPGMAG